MKTNQEGRGWSATGQRLTKPSSFSSFSLVVSVAALGALALVKLFFKLDPPRVAVVFGKIKNMCFLGISALQGLLLTARFPLLSELS